MLKQTLPKTLYEALKEQKQPNNDMERSFLADGKYEILPAFYKTILNLKKAKRQFAVIIHATSPKINHLEIITELNLFFSGEHCLYNGQNGTPAVRMDGTNKSKNFVFQESHFGIVYQAAEGEFIGSFGSPNYVEERDPEMLKQGIYAEIFSPKEQQKIEVV